jgi:hypothetical protein
VFLNRQDVADQAGSHIPLTAIGLDEDEFMSLMSQLQMEPDEDRSGRPFIVLCYSKRLQWLYDRYKVIGGDILFQVGPLPSGSTKPEGEVRVNT